MTFDQAQALFREAPSAQTAGTYLSEALRYEADDMIGDDTFHNALAEISDHLRDAGAHCFDQPSLVRDLWWFIENGFALRERVRNMPQPNESHAGSVFVATYEHRHGSDVRVFATQDLACAWRDAIAREYWGDEIDEDMPGENVGHAYFDRMGDRPKAEYFNIEECKVEGAPERPTLAIFIEGGLIQSICSNQPAAFKHIRIMTVDSDEGNEGTYLVTDREGGSYQASVVEDYGVEEADIDLSAIRELTPEELGAVVPSGFVDVMGVADGAEEEQSKFEKSARKEGWVREGDGPIIYNVRDYDSWKAAVSWSPANGPIYDTWEECCEMESIEVDEVVP